MTEEQFRAKWAGLIAIQHDPAKLARAALMAQGVPEELATAMAVGRRWFSVRDAWYAPYFVYQKFEA